MEEKIKAVGVFWIDPRVYLQDPFKHLPAVINRQGVGTVTDEQFIFIFAKGFHRALIRPASSPWRYSGSEKNAGYSHGAVRYFYYWP